MAQAVLKQRPRRASLWRYNYAILAGGGYWVIVLPVAASMVTMLWMFPLQSVFNQVAATKIAELMIPILGAFLAAHTMAPEYRSGVGAVLACKPVSLHRVVVARVALALAVALVLGLTVLMVSSLLLSPVDVWTPLLATLPSLWFLSMLAMTFATLFRNSLAGFAVAAAIWALDFGLGYAIHPIFSLQGYAAMLDKDPLAALWIPGKVALLVAGTFLAWLHSRLIGRVCRPPERQDVIRVVVSVAVVVLVYCATGAATTVGFAYVNRSHLPTEDSVWIRKQLQVYGPVPVAKIFGPAFEAYVSEPPPANSASATTHDSHMIRLRQALTRWPRSMWADGIAYDYALEANRMKNPGAKDFLAVADHYPASPFAPHALAEVIRVDQGVSDMERLVAARRLVRDYSRSPEVEVGAAELKAQPEGRVAPREMEDAALKAAAAGNHIRRPGWLLLAAQSEAKLGNTAAAKKNALEAKREADGLLAEVRRVGPGMSEVGPHVPEVTQAMLGAIDLLKKLGGA